jgi:hypothetical protein
MRLLGMMALCATLGGCAASAPEVRARLGEEYIGKNIDMLVMKWGPPSSSFRMTDGRSSNVWQLSSETAVYNNGVAKTYTCRVSVIAAPTGIIQQLDTEDPKAGYGILSMVGAYGSMCAERLGMKPQG